MESSDTLVRFYAYKTLSKQNYLGAAEIDGYKVYFFSKFNGGISNFFKISTNNKCSLIEINSDNHTYTDSYYFKSGDFYHSISSQKVDCSSIVLDSPKVTRNLK